MPKPDGAALAGARLGLELAPPDAADPVRGGLEVRAVRPGGPAARAGILPGMRVTRIGGQGVGTLDDAGARLESLGTGGRVAVSVAAIERNAGFLIARTGTTELTAD
jgi:S1-C subfamily serine protease